MKWQFSLKKKFKCFCFILLSQKLTYDSMGHYLMNLLFLVWLKTILFNLKFHEGITKN